MTETSWPTPSRIKREPGVPTLVLFVHPRCPCSRASLGELALLLPEVSRRVNTQVLFIRPPGFPHQWEQTDLWHTAAQLPGVQMSLDDDGVEALNKRKKPL